MSKAIDNAEAIKDRLKAAPLAHEIATPLDITGLDIIVDRQKNILSEIAKAVAKTKGTAIVIAWLGYKTLDANARTPRMGNLYNVCVWSKPVIEAGNYPADEVIEAVINRLWQWVPGGGHAFGEAEVTGGGLVADTKYLKYDCDINIPTSH